MNDRQNIQGNDLVAVCLALVVVLCWSTVATAFKLGLQHFSVAQLLFLSSTVSTLFFVGVALVVRRPKSSAKTKTIGALLGLLNPLFYYFVLFAAYERLPAQIAQPLNCTHAIVTALIAIPVLKQLPKFRVWIGTLIGYFGVVVLVTQGSFTEFDFNMVGVLLALGSSLIWATYWILSVRYSHDTITLLLTGFLVATPCIGAYCVLFDELPAMNWTSISFGLWIGLGEMGLAFLLWQRALKTASKVSLIAPLAYLSPALSLLFIQFVLHEPVHPMTIVGLFILLCGIAIVHFGHQFKKG